MNYGHHKDQLPCVLLTLGSFLGCVGELRNLSPLKGILSRPTNFFYVKELILLSSETYFLSRSAVPFPSKLNKNQISWY